MKNLKLIAWSLMIAASSASYADGTMLETATKEGCFICHSLQHKTGPAIPLAPAYSDIADRYKDDKTAVETLTQRILKGTVNDKQNWEGKVNMRFMPPNVNVSPEEAKRLAEWIVSIKADTVSEEVVTHEGMLTLAAQNGCIACHGIDKETDSHYIPLAPTYRQVAVHYKDNPDAKKILVDSILKGTVDNPEKKWPEVNMRFMPPNPTLKQEDAEKLATWILSLPAPAAATTTPASPAK
ncbi:MAG: hypothetical protein RI964_238 [Pseudomonadota bacterium]|jgi:cytochrome c